MAITNYYPCAPTAQTTPATSSLCNKCVTAQNPSDACTSSESKNSTDNTSVCSVFCDTGCNTACTDSSLQTLCNTGHQSMSAHGDIGAFPGSTVSANDFIYEKWTTSFFAALNTKLSLAETVGVQSSQGSAGSFTNPQVGDPVTAKLYNDVETKLSGFVDGSYATVAVDDLITVTVANAIKTAYESAKFKTTVCDVCNSEQHIGGTCGCNCSCGCSCSCGCGCPCSCSCNTPCECGSHVDEDEPSTPSAGG